MILWTGDTKNWLTGKDPGAGKDWRQEEKGTTEDEMVGWHQGPHGQEFEQALGVVMDSEVWHTTVHWLQRVRHDWVTELTESYSCD